MQRIEYSDALKRAENIARLKDNDSVEAWLDLKEAGSFANHDEQWAVCVMANWYPPEWTTGTTWGVVSLNALYEELSTTYPDNTGYTVNPDDDESWDDESEASVIDVLRIQVLTQIAEELRAQLESFYARNYKTLVRTARFRYQPIKKRVMKEN